MGRKPEVECCEKKISMIPNSSAKYDIASVCDHVVFKSYTGEFYVNAQSCFICTTESEVATVKTNSGA